MKLVVGLGNPGEEYLSTRHNVGFLVADELVVAKLPRGVVIKKPNVFMNESGDFVLGLTKRYSLNPSHLYIIHDDLDIRLGEYKIQFGRGPKDHNGVIDVEDKLGTKDFWRVRIGVDNRPLDGKPRGEEYVLQNFTDEERVILDQVIKEIASKFDNI